MPTSKLQILKKLLEEKSIRVPDLEFTSNNFNHNGSPIDYKVPTITTENCEIGFLNGGAYFVFIIELQSFSSDLFSVLKNKKDVIIYGYADFKKTLFPSFATHYQNLMESAKNEKYLQIQFDFSSHNPQELLSDYLDLLQLFKSQNVVFFNQLKKY